MSTSRAHPALPLDRRDFLASLGALSVAAALPHSVARAAQHPAAAPSDFMFAPGLVYLQTGSLGPTPWPVMDRTIAAWHELELNPVAYGYGSQEKAMDAVRAQAAAFLGCATEELVLTKCTTDGINSIAQGMTLNRGDRILTTDQEHPGGRVGWDYVAQRFGAVIDVVPLPPEVRDAHAVVDRFAKLITPRTRVFSFSHLLTSTGLRMPVAELSALARAHGCIAVVDGAQSVGGIAVNVKALGCHAYATSGHKWLLGPKGTGLLYLSNELGDTVKPIAQQSGRAAYSASSGVTNIPGVIGLGAAIDYHQGIGTGTIEAHNLDLASQVYDGIKTLPQLELVSPPPGPMASPLVSYRLPATRPAGALATRLGDRHKVVVKVVPTNWFNGHRISTHLFNTAQDVAALIDALRVELASG
ncbi:MAG TPA: aminotransferase class V-fold PLP-dependent enzyme [Gemmatimonadales bacterium]|jgi:selenocysteine lyase/cysteine desulfurase